MKDAPWQDVAEKQTQRAPMPAPRERPPGRAASVVPQRNGTAVLLVDGAAAGIYASEERARQGLQVLERIGVVGGAA